jgi:hypothetical protein
MRLSITLFGLDLFSIDVSTDSLRQRIDRLLDDWLLCAGLAGL